MDSKQLALRAASILDSKKAVGLKVLRVRDITVMADYFVLASGTSSTHVKSLAEEVEFKLKEEGVKPLRTEGFGSQGWLVLDYANVIVHVFSNEARSFFDLEHLWADGEEVLLDLPPQDAGQEGVRNSDAPQADRL